MSTTHVALRDGSTVSVRPVTEADAPALRAFLEELSEDARYLRFFSAAVDLGRQAVAAAALPPELGHGLLALAGRPARIVGHAEYVRDNPHRAEVAFEVAREHEGHGIATTLLAQLAEHAAARGVVTFTASVLPANHRMIGVFRASGFAVDVSVAAGELEVEMPTELSAAGLARFDDRSRTAAAAAVAHVLRPASVGVFAAPGHDAGRALLINLGRAGFTGTVAVGDAGAEAPVQPVELAVLAAPPATAEALARRCGEAGVAALVVLADGLTDAAAAAGGDHDETLRATCRDFGMRLVGPGSLGVLNTAPDVRLHAGFGPVTPAPGRVAFAAQSPAYGVAGLAEAVRRGIGLSSFVSTGHKADLSGNDLLQYWEQDPHTAVVLLQLESFGNPRRFGRIARRMTAGKPIVAVKSGRSAAVDAPDASRTAALLAGSDAAVEALFAHAGVVRTDTLGEAFDVCGLLAAQPVPRGERVAIVSDARGPAVACGDACRAAGLVVTVERVAGPGAVNFRAALAQAIAGPAVDAVIAIAIAPALRTGEGIAPALADVAPDAEKAGVGLLAVFMAHEETAPATVPSFATPEEAARALGHAVRHGRWRRSLREPAASPDGLDEDAAAGLVARLLPAGDRWLGPEDVDALLGHYGLRRPAWRLAAGAAEAGRCARELGGTVAVKAIAPGVQHKSDIGAVRLGVTGSAGASRAASAAAAAVRAAGHEPEGFVVQAMVPGGVEMLAGVAGHPDFGPVVACGAGGRAVELLGDVAVRLAPLTGRDAHDMVRSLRTFPLLDGHRGAAPCDVGALEDVLIRVAALAAARPEIAELDCHPVIVGRHGAMVVDARVRLAAPAPRRPFVALDR